jgi:2-methylcitrate dehydratase PrpD
VQPGIFFKQYPVCSGAHAAVELTERLLRENALSGDDVRKVICEVTPVVAISLVYERPVRWQEAQFSLPFAVGAMLARRRLDIDSLTDATLSDPSVRAAMAKVEMRRVDALQSDDAPEGARVTVIATDGRQFQDYLGQPTGMPGNPLADERLHGKFLRCAASGGIDARRARRLLLHLTTLEGAPRAFPDLRDP